MKKTFQILFIASVVFILAFLLINTDLRPEVASTLDNRMLTAIPASFSEWMTNGEAFLQDRIGYRTDMMIGYQKLLYYGFKVMSHPSYMYGSDGHIFLTYDYCISDYQHTNINQACLTQNPIYLQRIADYTTERDIGFLFVFPPDKKTIYPEYYPKSIHVAPNPSRASLYRERLSTVEGMDFVFFEDILHASKSDDWLLYNKLFDVSHWNDHGKFVAMQEMVEAIRRTIPDVPSLSADDYVIDYVEANVGEEQNYFFAKGELVPQYTLKDQQYQNVTSKYTGLEYIPGSFKVIENNNAPVDKTVLVVHDSYFNYTDRFICPLFSRVVFGNSTTMQNLDYYLNVFDVDYLIFETAERVTQWPMNINTLAPLPTFGTHDVVSTQTFPLSASTDAPYTRLTETITHTGDPEKTVCFVQLGEKTLSARYTVSDDGQTGTFSISVDNSLLTDVAEMTVHLCQPRE